MNSFYFSKRAQKSFRKLEESEQKRILEKLRHLKHHPLILSVLEPVTDLKPATHRLRIGNYRALLVSEGNGMFAIIKVGHRRSIYR